MVDLDRLCFFLIISNRNFQKFGGMGMGDDMPGMPGMPGMPEMPDDYEDSDDEGNDVLFYGHRIAIVLLSDLF